MARALVLWAAFAAHVMLYGQQARQVKSSLASRIASSPASKGQFHGELSLKDIGEGQVMQLLSSFGYTDWHGNTLTAPAGFKSDGATIPRVAWSIVGGPWDGPYRKAAVVHDVGCATHQLGWKETHRLFYEASIDAGTDHKTALAMYLAVLVGGPRWELVASISSSTREGAVAKAEDELAFRGISKQRASIKTSPIYEPNSGMVADSAGHGALPILKGYSATALELTNTRQINEDYIKNFKAEVERRAESPDPVTPEEVERRAAGLADLPPAEIEKIFNP